MKPGKALLVLSVLAFTSGPVAADYLGFSAGQSKLRQDDFNGNIIDDSSFSSIDVEDSDTGFRFLAGLDLNETFAFELGYSDFGERSVSGYSSGCCFWANGPVSFTVVADGIDLGLVGKLPASESFSFLARLGLLLWDSQASFKDSNGSVSGSEDDTDAFFGLGGELRAGEAVSIRGELTRYAIDESDIDSLSMSLIYRFRP